jgi:purine-cytosine permease-like protein
LKRTEPARTATLTQAEDSGQTGGHGAVEKRDLVEKRGIEFIPEDERRSKPRELGIVFFGTQIQYGSLVVGALPVTFGLDWLGSLTAMIVGTIVGSAAVGAMSVMGPKAGTNGSVTSSAFFGIRGRYVGSFIAQVIDLGYFAMGLWISAPPLVHGGHLLFGLPEGNVATTIAVIFSAAIVLALGIFGHGLLVAWEKFTACGNVICLALLVAFCIGHFHPSPDVKAFPLVLKAWWPSWILAVTVFVANAISYSPFVGDYARYVPTRTPSRLVFWWPFGGMVAGCFVGCLCGTLIGLSVANPNEVEAQMLSFVPHVFLLPIVVIGLIANSSNGGMVFYNGILDLQAILWKLTRLHVGIIFSAIGLFVAYLGLTVSTFMSSIVALSSIVTVLVTPWIIINVIGYFRHGQRLRARDLQAFGRTADRGIYWYTRGFNVPAVVAWLVSSTIGILFSDTALFVGPLASVAKGVDLSFLSAALVASALYLALDQLLPSASKVRESNLTGSADIAPSHVSM